MKFSRNTKTAFKVESHCHMSLPWTHNTHSYIELHQLLIRSFVVIAQENTLMPTDEQN